MDYDPKRDRIDIMLGDLGTVDRHLTHSLPAPRAVEIIKGEGDRDEALRIELEEGQVLLSRGVLTLSVSPNSGMMVGGVWRAEGVGEFNVVSPHLEIDGPNGKTAYEGMDVFAAFEPQSRGLRMLVEV